MPRTTVLAALLRTAVVRVAFGAGSLRPIRERVVLATSHANEISGNLAEIEDELRDRLGTEAAIVVLAAKVGLRPRELARTLWLAARAGYHLATARAFVVDDHFFPMYAIRPRPGTSFLQVWHACGAFKRFGYSVAEREFGADLRVLERFPIHTNYDLCLVSAMRFAPRYAEAFRLPLERFTSRFGIPRTDLFFDDRRRTAAAEAVRRRHGIAPGARVVLYAPTFRGRTVGRARDPLELDLSRLAELLDPETVVLVRSHPFATANRGAPAATGAHPPRSGRLIDVSGDRNINELMLISDVLVTDYSSAIYEFALLERPMAFFAPDLAAYEQERGFYFDYRSGVPGPVFESTDELAGWLRSGEVDLERVRRFREEAFDVADGRATQRLVGEYLLPRLGRS